DGKRTKPPLEQIFSSRYATPDTDLVVNPGFARGLGSDGQALAPNAISIVIKGVDHFEGPFHPQINKLFARLTRLMAQGKDLATLPVEVNGKIVGRLIDFTPEKPLELNVQAPFGHDVVRFGSVALAPARLLRALRGAIVNLRYNVENPTDAPAKNSSQKGSNRWAFMGAIGVLLTG